MLICIEEICECLQHQFLDYLKKGQNEEATYILKQLENFDELKDTSGLTLLHYAVRYGNAEMTQCLIDEGCDVNAQDSTGVTPLMLAVKNKNSKITEILIKDKADIYVADDVGTSSLLLAIDMRLHSSPLVPLTQNPHVILEMMFEVVNDDFSEGGLTQFLLNTNDLVKFAVMVFGSEEIIKFMLENGYSIDLYETKQNITALHCAIRLGRLHNAKMLIEHGANVDVVDKFGYSPLLNYTSNFEMIDVNSEVLKSLLRLSNSLAKTRNIVSLISRINGEYFYMRDVEELLRKGKKKTVRAVFESGIDVDACIRQGESLCYLLTSNKNPGVLDLLAEFNIKFDVNKPTLEGFTALMEAAFSWCPKKVEFLLQHGADANIISPNGSSALTYTDYNVSLLRRNPEKESDVAKVIELLLIYGANNVQSFFSKKRDVPFCLPTKVILAHLAMLAAVDKSSLTDSTLGIIESKPEMKDYFDLCTEQLVDMNNSKVNGTVTLFDLLREREELVVVYARNQELISAWSDEMKYWSHLETYYFNTLQTRFSKVLDEAKLQKKAALVIEALTGLCSDVYRHIVYKIFAYLSRQDLYNLCEIDSIPQ